MLKLRRSVLPLLLVGAMAVACDDDDNGEDTTGPSVSDLAGSYVMTQGTLDPDLDPSDADEINLLLISNTPPTLEIQSDGSFTLTLDLVGQPQPIPVSGSIAITGSNTGTITTLIDPDDPADATFTLSGDILTINVPDAELLDLTGDGMIDESDSGELDVTFQRQ